MWKPGQPGKAAWNARESQKASAGGFFSDELYRVHSTRPTTGIRQTSYRIATLDGVEQRGMYVRTQLLKVPEGTLAYVTESENDGDESDADSGDDVPDGGNDGVYKTHRQSTHGRSSPSNTNFASAIRSISPANSLRVALSSVGWRATRVFAWGS